MIEFYAPVFSPSGGHFQWCTQCDLFVPTWNDLASAAPLMIRFGEVDIMQERGVTTRFKVQQYPTLYLIDNVVHGQET